MSKIEELIERICPNGVEYRKLDDICDVITGGEAPLDCIKGEQKDDVYCYPIWGNGADVYGYAKDYKIDQDATVISSIGANTGTVYYHKAFFTPIVRLKVLIPKIDQLLSKFLYYSLNTIKIKSNSSSVPNMNAAAIKKIEIPLPPIEVQQEIVRILDSFSNLTNSIIDALKNESILSKKEYDYYRESLLSFENKNIEICKLSNLCIIGDGLHGTPKYDISGEYFFINGTNLRKGRILLTKDTKRLNSKEYYKYKIELDNNTILMSINGTIGSIAFYNNENIVLGKSVAYFKNNSTKLMSKYLFYYLQTNEAYDFFVKNLTGTVIKNLGLKALRSFLIPVPPLAEQERIVSILDKLEPLVNEQEQCLQAEIQKVQQQYEYYRDQLLTFKKG